MSDHRTATPASTRRILGASLVGTAIEFYDFYIYGAAASLVFGALFFPSTSASATLMAAYATFAIAFIARPVGAVAFGHFGDRIGRKSTLVASLVMMGGSTLLIGFLPTYQTVGWLAPFLLCLLRFGQGFGLGGEWGGAALLAVENAPRGKRGRYGMFPQLGAPVGFICSNGLFLILGVVLTPEQFQSWGWRLPFLASVALVAVGLWVRLKLTETAGFVAALKEAPPAAVPIGELFRRHALTTLCGALSAVACFTPFYLATVFALGYGVTTLGYSREVLLGVQLGAILFLALGIVVSGYASDRISARKVLMTGCVMAIGLGPLFGRAFESGSLVAIWAFLSAMLFVMGLSYGPLGAFLPSLFPARVRYTGASMAFNVAGILGGGLTPFMAQALADRGGLTWVGLLLAGAGAVSLAALASLRRS
jgi:MFS family permease